MHSDAIISAKNAEGRQLQVHFFRCGDRYAHRVLFLDGEQETIILHSTEGGEDDHWPPSPPLQQLTTEDRPDGRRVALLVGMAGRTHWSVSVEPHASAAMLLFDVACRFHEESSPLGSCYRCEVPLRLDEERKTGQLSLSGHLCHVSTSAPKLSDLAQLIADESVLTIRPRHPSGPPPQTARWTYRVEVGRAE